MTKVKWNSPSTSFNFEVCLVPGFDPKKFPFLIMRDDFSLRLFNVATQKTYILREAPYASQRGKIYRTMDVLHQADADDFELIYLQTEGSGESQQVTQINRCEFSEAFVSVLKSLAAV